MTMTLLTGWSPDEPILELPVDDRDNEAAHKQEATELIAEIQQLLDEPINRPTIGQLSCRDSNLPARMVSGLVGVVGAMLGA